MTASIWNPGTSVTPVITTGGCYTSVMDFGAVGDGIVDDTNAIQNAINHCQIAGNGDVVWLPAGKYKITAQLLITWPNMADSSTQAKTVLRGAGSGITFIEDYSAGTSTGIYYDFSSYTGDAVNLHYLNTWTGGFSLTKQVNKTVIAGNSYSQIGVGVGLAANKIPAGLLSDLLITGYNTSMLLTDCLGGAIRDCYVHECEHGIVLAYNSFSPPNAYSLDKILIAACRTWGVKVVGGNVTLTNITVESNGLMGTVSGGIYYQNDNVITLPKGITINDCYFENNRGAADIYIETPTTMVVEIANTVSGCLFARNSSTDYVTNNIYVLATGTTRMNLLVTGCGFKNYSTYVASSARLCIAYGGTLTTINPVYLGNTFTDTVDAPVNRDLSGSVASLGFGTGLAYISADGDNLDLCGSLGVVPNIGIAPKVNDSQYLGGATKRWSALYSVLANISGTITWGNYTIAVPTGGSTTFLRNDGTWATPTVTVSSTVTITSANPGVITWVTHGLSINAIVSFSTTGALPTNIVAGTPYYVKTVVSVDSFTISATAGGVVIDTTAGTQSGVHTGSSATLTTPTLNAVTGVGHITNSPIQFGSDASTYVGNSGTNLDLANTVGVVPGLGLSPKTDNSQYLGGTALRWTNVYSVLGNYSGAVTFGSVGTYISHDGTNLDLAGTVGVVPGVGIAPAANNSQYLGGSALRWSSFYSVLANISGAITWGSYSIAVPSGSTTTFLRNDGTWATPAGGGGGVSLSTVNTWLAQQKFKYDATFGISDIGTLTEISGVPYLYSSSTSIGMGNSTGSGVGYFSTAFRPTINAYSDLGSSTYKWNNAYIANTITWGSYSISAPTGSTTTFLRNDGTWAVPTSSGATSVDYTATLTGYGFTTYPTATVRGTRVGNVVTLDLPNLIATSSTTVFIATALPAALIPATLKQCLISVVDNGISMVGVARINNTGSIDVYSGPGNTAWTASGTKGIIECSISYTVV